MRGCDWSIRTASRPHLSSTRSLQEATMTHPAADAMTAWTDDTNLERHKVPTARGRPYTDLNTVRNRQKTKTTTTDNHKTKPRFKMKKS